MASACTGAGGPAADATADAGDPAAAAGIDAASLEVVDGASEVYCDGTDRLVGEIRGATPGERIVVSSPQPIELTADQLDATADAEGTYRMMWRCGQAEAGQPWELRIAGEDSGRRATIAFVGTVDDPDGSATLDVALFDATFVCDGRSKDLGELSNAAPREQVTFAGPRADNLVDGTADGDGRLTLTWQCSPAEAGTWDITARGFESNRIGEFTVVGVRPDEIPTPTVTVVEDPFLCDGVTRVFATLSGFLPNEVVAFSSPQSSDLVDGRADDAGDLPLQWTCGAADVESVWELTAVGTRSERTVTFVVTGAPPPPAPDPTVTFTEEPFVCDGATRVFATIDGFAPREFIDFTSPQAEHLRQGQADEDGALQVRWTCDATDVDRTWEITATGATTLRAVTFRLTATAPGG